MIICKFGGSSVADIESAKNIKKIVCCSLERKFVVVSAIGKSNLFKFKVTDELYNLFYQFEDTKKINKDILNRIIFKYKWLAKQLGFNYDKQLEQEKIKILKEFNHLNIQDLRHYIISRGEFLSAKIFAKFLNIKFLDAKDYIIFSKNSKIDELATKKKLSKLNLNKQYVIGGFYGADKKGDIRTFSRGGSDITGSVIAKCLNAEIYENYTDVSGIYNKNPNIFNYAKKLPILNFKTATQMANFGNEVVHKDALKLLKKCNTILLVKNTKKHNNFGTVLIKGDYYFDETFLCVCKEKLVITEQISLDKYNKFKQCGNYNNIFYKNKYYLFLKNSIKSNIELFDSNKNEVFNICKIIIFSNILLQTKIIKNIKKIKKKLKNIIIFSEFLHFSNNYVIIVKQENTKELINIINKYLH